MFKRSCVPDSFFFFFPFCPFFSFDSLCAFVFFSNCSDHGYDWEGGKVWVDGATNTTCVRNVTLTVMDVKQIVAVGVYAAPASDADTPIVKIIFDNTLVELILDPKSTPPIYLRSSICGQGPHQFVSRSGFRGDISYQGVVELDTLSVGRNLTVISDCDPLDKTCSEYFEGQKVNGSDPTVVGGANGTAANGTAGEGEFGTRRQRRLLRYRSMATEEEEAKDVEDQNDQNDQNEEPQPAEINAVVNAVVVRSDRRRLNDSTTSSSSNASSTNSSFLSCVEVDLTMPKGKSVGCGLLLSGCKGNFLTRLLPFLFPVPLSHPSPKSNIYGTMGLLAIVGMIHRRWNTPRN